jgi:hypothetical protein
VLKIVGSSPVTDGRRTTDDGRTTDAKWWQYLTWPFGSGELIIIQIQNMNIKLNMKDINKIFAEDCGFEPRSGLTKDYEIGICCSFAKQGSPHLHKIGRLDFSLREHEREMKALFFSCIWSVSLLIKCNTICVTTFFYWISRVCQKKKN